MSALEHAVERAKQVLAEEPTQRQLEVLRVIASTRRNEGHPPTVRELVDALGVSSTNTVACHLSALKRRGLVTWATGKGRTLAVTTAGERWLKRGRTAAPALAFAPGACPIETIDAALMHGAAVGAGLMLVACIALASIVWWWLDLRAAHRDGQALEAELQRSIERRGDL